MQLITPEFGLIFWQLIAFLLLVFVLSRYAWKPILAGLKAREESIEQALRQAEIAKRDMAQLQADNQKLLEEARSERDKILKSAQKAAEEIREEAKSRTTAEVNKMLDDARQMIETEKSAAIEQMRHEIATLSIQVAEAVLKRELENPTAQKQLVDALMKDLKVN